MNIFFLHDKPKTSVSYYHDAHVRKITLEVAQMLCTAHNVLDKKKEELYKPTHINHPMTKWVRENSKNYDFTYNYFCCLCEEFEYRFKKTHKCSLLKIHLVNKPKNISISKKITEIPKCMPKEYIIENDLHKSYRNYYVKEKLTDKNGKKQKWTRRGIPSWLKV